MQWLLDVGEEKWTIEAGPSYPEKAMQRVGRLNVTYSINVANDYGLRRDPIPKIAAHIEAMITGRHPTVCGPNIN